MLIAIYVQLTALVYSSVPFGSTNSFLIFAFVGLNRWYLGSSG